MPLNTRVKYLSLAINTNDSTGRLVGSSHEDGVSTDSVHVYADTSLDVIEMNVTIFSNKIYDVIFWRHLHGHREIILGLRWKKDINCFLRIGLVSSWGLPHFYYMQLQ